MGAEQQRIKDKLATLDTRQIEHIVKVEKEMDRYTEIITNHMTQLQKNITLLNSTVGNLRIDVQVLKAIIERMEKNLHIMDKSD